MEEVIKAAVPWLIVLFTVLILVTYIPWISLIVPSLLGVL
jgi:C4-dicarboxylate transporter DctM subunit